MPPLPWTVYVPPAVLVITAKAVWGAPVAATLPQGIQAVARRADAMAFELEGGLDGLAHIRVVVHDQHAAVANRNRLHHCPRDASVTGCRSLTSQTESRQRE